MNDLLYRYDGWNMSFDGFDIQLHLSKFRIFSHTPKGVWILIEGGKLQNHKWIQNKKWVSNTSRKRFAYPTKKEALESLLYRKESQIAIIERQLKIAKAVIQKIEELNEIQRLT